MTEAISHLLPLYILYSSTACTLTWVPLPLHLSYQLLDLINSLEVHKTSIVAVWCVFTPFLLSLHVVNQNMHSVTEVLVLLHTHCVNSQYDSSTYLFHKTIQWNRHYLALSGGVCLISVVVVLDERCWFPSCWGHRLNGDSDLECYYLVMMWCIICCSIFTDE